MATLPERYERISSAQVDAPGAEISDALEKDFKEYRMKAICVQKQ